MITHIAPGVKDLMSMLKSINGLNRLTIFSHCRGEDNSINARSSIFPLERNKIVWGPMSERAPVVVTEIGNCRTLSGVLIEITHNDDVLMGVANGKIGEVLKKRCRVFD